MIHKFFWYLEMWTLGFLIVLGVVYIHIPGGNGVWYEVVVHC